MSTLSARLASARVLIVDDQPSAALMLKSVLHTLGVKDVDIAHDHRQAITACRKHAYRVLFVDYHLDGPITGPELIHLLKKRQHITPFCGLVMLSGDRCTEVILTGLTLEPDAFLTKPLTAQRVQKTLAETLQDITRRQPIYDAIAQKTPQQAIRLCQHTLSHHGYHPKLAELLWSLLIQTQQWAALDASLAQWQTQPPNAHWQRFHARSVHQQGDVAQAIRLLETQLTRTPLHLPLYDELADYLAENGQLHQALAIAKQVFAFTPSIHHRALKVAQLAARTDNTELLIKAGRTLASHLPIIDVGWVVSLAKYMAIFEGTYFAQSSAAFQRELKQALKGIDHKAQRRLLPAQRPYLSCYGHVVMARLQLGNQQSLKAKRRILMGLSGYFNQLSRLPSVILADALPVLMHLGEIQLITACKRVLANREQFDEHSAQRLQALNANTALIQALSPLESQLHDAATLLAIAPHQAVSHYRNILKVYPLCSEANLGYLQCQLTLGQTPDADALLAIQGMPLPDSLAAWRQRLLTQWAAYRTTVSAPWHRHTLAYRFPSIQDASDRDCGDPRITALLPRTPSATTA